jgi:hypothetical protein
LITTGQVLQLNITSKPFSFIASFNVTSLPEISFNLLSAFGIPAPNGSGSFIVNDTNTIAGNSNKLNIDLFI